MRELTAAFLSFPFFYFPEGFCYCYSGLEFAAGVVAGVAAVGMDNRDYSPVVPHWGYSAGNYCRNYYFAADNYEGIECKGCLGYYYNCYPDLGAVGY